VYLIPTFDPRSGKETPRPCSMTSPIPAHLIRKHLFQIFILPYPHVHQFVLSKYQRFSHLWTPTKIKRTLTLRSMNPQKCKCIRASTIICMTDSRIKPICNISASNFFPLNQRSQVAEVAPEPLLTPTFAVRNSRLVCRSPSFPAWITSPAREISKDTAAGVEEEVLEKRKTYILTRTCPGPGFSIGSSSMCVLIVPGSE